jgi:stearoyl-CoA desaturase (delta-9 desaturase)
LAKPAPEKYPWVSCIPFFAVHLFAITAFFTGFRLRDVLVCIGLYYVRMWAITAGYHRYFAHRAYKTNRAFQFFLALLGTTATQKGPLWWAAHHRHHHKESDQEADIHSPVQRGFWYSHMFWILDGTNDETRFELIRDFARYPELRFLNKFHLVPPILLAVALFFIGGYSLLAWGFFLSTTLLWHGTFTINSLSHIFGKRRYRTTDTSRNNWFLALLTCGEGWHNNHHYHQNTANQGWFWYEVDASFYVLKVLSWVGLVSDLRLPSNSVKLAHLKYTPEEKARLNAHIPFRAMAKGRMAEAKEKVRGAIAHAHDALPGKAPSPSPVFKRQ